MPIVRIEIAEGRSNEEKTRLMKAVTMAIHDAIGVPLSTIHIMLKESPGEHIMIGGELLPPKEPRDKA
jgi:4-oxalocrotonate tautomerase